MTVVSATDSNEGGGCSSDRIHNNAVVSRCTSKTDDSRRMASRDNHHHEEDGNDNGGICRSQGIAGADQELPQHQHDDAHLHLPAEVWAETIDYLQWNSRRRSRSDATNSSTSMPTLHYADLLRLSTINRQFLHDVASLVQSIHVTSPAQLMHPKVAAQRFGLGVREVTIDCLFEMVQVKQSSKRTVRAVKPVQPQTMIRPDADAYRHVTTFLSAFPNCERVVLGGHQIVNRSLTFAEDGYTCEENHFRHFHPFHAQPGSGIGGGVGGNAPIVSNLEAFLRGETTLADADTATTTSDDESTATGSTNTSSTSTSSNPFISARQYDQRLQRNEMASDLICSICDAYSDGSIPPNTNFLGLLEQSCCPNRARNGGIVLAGPYAESCEYCCRLCSSFPFQDIKNVLLDPSNYEESVFDRMFCMSSRRILHILAEREDLPSLSPLVDADFVAQCLTNKRFAVLSAVLDLNLLPSVDEDVAIFINDEVEKATSLNQLKPDISRDLFNRLVDGGLSLRPESFAIFE